MRDGSDEPMLCPFRFKEFAEEHMQACVPSCACRMTIVRKPSLFRRVFLHEEPVKYDACSLATQERGGRRKDVYISTEDCVYETYD